MSPRIPISAFISGPPPAAPKPPAPPYISGHDRQYRSAFLTEYNAVEQRKAGAMDEPTFQRLAEESRATQADLLATELWSRAHRHGLGNYAWRGQEDGEWDAGVLVHKATDAELRHAERSINREQRGPNGLAVKRGIGTLAHDANEYLWFQITRELDQRKRRTVPLGPIRVPLVRVPGF